MKQRIQVMQAERREPADRNPVVEIGYEQQQAQEMREVQAVAAQGIQEAERQNRAAATQS